MRQTAIPVIPKSGNRAEIDRIEKLYVEVTNRCNLTCRTCMRNSWEESSGDMAFQLFKRIVDQFEALSEDATLFIGGIGEPLSHPDILDMIRYAKDRTGRVEMISNGILLTADMAAGLIDAGLDCLWVSIDGARPEHYADIRLGNHLPEILENLKTWRDLSSQLLTRSVELGISFVAMKRNIGDLAEIVDLAETLGARHFSISHVEPYTEALYSEMLYQDRVNEKIPASGTELPRNDNGMIPPDLLERIRKSFQMPFPRRMPKESACPFFLRKSISVRWDGQVSPCLPLLHGHDVNLKFLERTWAAHSIGSLDQHPLEQIWMDKANREFRKTQEEFSFAPCLTCYSCDLPSLNGEDCFGNAHPACGGCLWAQGFIICP